MGESIENLENLVRRVENRESTVFRRTLAFVTVPAVVASALLFYSYSRIDRASEANKLVDQAQANATHAEKRADQLGRDLDQTGKKLAATNQEAKELKERIASVENESVSLKTKVGSLEGDLAVAHKDVEVAAQRLESQNGKLRELEEGLKKSNEQLVISKRETDALRARLASFDSGLADRLRKELDSTKAQLTECQKRLAVLTNRRPG